MQCPGVRACVCVCVYMYTRMRTVLKDWGSRQANDWDDLSSGLSRRQHRMSNEIQTQRPGNRGARPHGNTVGVPLDHVQEGTVKGRKLPQGLPLASPQGRKGGRARRSL